jgi:Flp pilus assembly protein TadD
MATSSPNATILAHAWANHREGRNEAAISEFDRVLRESPNDIDANFGMGLAQRALGRFDQAIASFRKVEELVQKMLAQEPGVDRWEMLTRMCEQRIAETESAKGAA